MYPKNQKKIISAFLLCCFAFAILEFFSSIAWSLEKNFSDLDKAYAPFLPAELRAEALAEIRAIDFHEENLERQPHVSFTSEESKTQDEINVLNRIHYFPGKRFDIWFMSQNRADHGLDFAHWNKLMILVDKAAIPKRAFYFEFGTQALEHGQAPKPAPYTAACFTCHASGPRVIRKQNSNWLPDLNPKAEALMGKWNQEIAHYKQVATYLPKADLHSPLPPIRFADARNNEELKHHSCTECHNANDGLRAPILRQHQYTALALLENGHMPQEGPKLSAAESLKQAKNCNSYGEAIR